jgi:uncharacterized protein with ParB-like and HNH nuclease domain
MARKKYNPNQEELFSPIPENESDLAEQQIVEKHKPVDYDVHEYPLDVLVQKYVDGKENDTSEMFIPKYQRKFVWDEKRQSKFIESLLLGLPIPFLFTADNEGRLEIVDGSQRIRTLEAFFNNKLVLHGLDDLTELDGFRFKDLKLSRQRRFARRTIRVISLTEKATPQIRQDLFRRINTTAIALTDMEERRGLFDGKFIDFIEECAQNPKFRSLCPESIEREERGEYSELVLRFFSYSENYLRFEHSVKGFIDDYIKEKQNLIDAKDNPDLIDDMRVHFEDVLDFVDKYFPNGFRKSKNSKSTPRVRFEAISIGVSLALKEKNNLIPKNVKEWLTSVEFQKWTETDAANNKSNVIGRIEFVRDKLLEK